MEFILSVLGKAVPVRHYNKLNCVIDLSRINVYVNIEFNNGNKLFQVLL